jgi:hypothetical protein
VSKQIWEDETNPRVAQILQITAARKLVKTPGHSPGLGNFLPVEILHPSISVTCGICRYRFGKRRHSFSSARPSELAIIFNAGLNCQIELWQVILIPLHYPCPHFPIKIPDYRLPSAPQICWGE